MSAPDVKPHDPDVCRYCRTAGLTQADWDRAVGGLR